MNIYNNLLYMGSYASKETKILKSINVENIPPRTCKGLYKYAKVIDVYDGDTITVIMKLNKGEQYY